MGVVFTGCSTKSESPSGMSVVHMVEAIGAFAPDRIDEQRLTYEITLENNGTEAVYVDYILPVLNEAIVARVLDEDLKVSVDMAIEPGEFATVGGTFRFDANGLSKQDIAAIGHLITSIQLSDTSLLEIPGRAIK